MTVKAVVFVIMFVFMIILLVYMVEFLPPLSVKSDMNTCCRNALLRMEVQGGMSEAVYNELEDSLKAMGLDNIVIHGTMGAKQGEEISLRVEADYAYSRFKSLFSRESVTQKMVYSKASISRKVIN